MTLTAALRDMVPMKSYGDGAELCYFRKIARQMPLRVLVVAEKPSIARGIIETVARANNNRVC